MDYSPGCPPSWTLHGANTLKIDQESKNAVDNMFMLELRLTPLRFHIRRNLAKSRSQFFPYMWKRAWRRTRWQHHAKVTTTSTQRTRKRCMISNLDITHTSPNITTVSIPREAFFLLYHWTNYWQISSITVNIFLLRIQPGTTKKSQNIEQLDENYRGADER